MWGLMSSWPVIRHGNVRWRFDESTRVALLESAWWVWPEEKRQIVDKLCLSDVAEFIAYAQARNSKHSNKRRDN